MLPRSILLAGCLGYQGIKTEATGNFSKTAFETVGMLSSSAITYEVEFDNFDIDYILNYFKVSESNKSDVRGFL